MDKFNGLSLLDSRISIEKIPYFGFMVGYELNELHIVLPFTQITIDFHRSQKAANDDNR
jgi:hypothetical protein